MNDSKARVIMAAVAKTLHVVAATEGRIDAGTLTEIADEIAEGRPDKWAECPLCGDDECDDDCPLESVRA